MNQQKPTVSIARLGGLLAEPVKPRAAPVRLDDVAFTLRGLEPWVAWSIAIYMALATIVMHPQIYWLWMFVVYAGAVGKWSQVFPPRSQLQMFLRGLSLLAGAFVLQLNAEGLAGGASGLFFFWIAAVSLCYSFMLRTGWNWSLVVVAALTYLMPSLHGMSNEPLLPVLAQGVFLLVFPPLVTMRFGRAMRRIEDALDESLVDRPTSLYNKAGLLRHGEPLVSSFTGEKKPVSLAVFNFSDLRQVHDAHGRRAGRKALAAVVRELVTIAGEQGFASRTGAMEFTLVLPGISHDRAVRMVEKQLGTPPRITVPAGSARAVVEPSWMVRPVSAEADALEDLQQEMSAHLSGDTSSGPPSQSSIGTDSQQLSEDFLPTTMVPNFKPA
ncbi:MAG: diguanylate cyclase [Ramlibacter sp.]